MKTYKNYQELGKAMLKENGIKIETAYVKNIEDYSPYAIYYTRIANNKTMNFRVIKPGEHVKNCLKITFDPDRYEKSYLVYFLESYKRVIQNWSHGTCQQHVNITTLTMVLSGILGRDAKLKPEFKPLIQV